MTTEIEVLEKEIKMLRVANMAHDMAAEAYEVQANRCTQGDLRIGIATGVVLGLLVGVTGALIAPNLGIPLVLLAIMMAVTSGVKGVMVCRMATAWYIEEMDNILKQAKEEGFDNE